MQEDDPPRRTYSDAQSAADLAVYFALKRSVAVRSLIVVAVAGFVTVRWFPYPALALVTGGLCGVANALLTMRSGERLVETGGVGGFVFSSFLRVGVFGIVPVAFALVGPWWLMGCYFAGFFLPLALYATSVTRAFERK